MLENHKDEEGTGKRKAFTVRAFGDQFGKPPDWVRRLVHRGKIKAIKDCGEWLIPATETDVILDSAAYQEGGQA
jgi:hypothetical protein